MPEVTRYTKLTDEDLAETHPELPPGWRRSMMEIQMAGGPWDCPACGGPSYLIYRCSRCGKDLSDHRTSGL